MNKQLDPKELRQYTDDEMPAELLGEYRVAKQTQLETPYLSRSIPQSNPQSDKPRNRKRNGLDTRFSLPHYVYSALLHYGARSQT